MNSFADVRKIDFMCVQGEKIVSKWMLCICDQFLYHILWLSEKRNLKKKTDRLYRDRIIDALVS